VVKGTGIIPFDPESVLSRLDIRLRTPTPIPGDLELPPLLEPMTPNNQTEATSQSDLIKRQLTYLISE
jgi:hypothetical protein